MTPLSNINVNDRTFNTADYAVEDLLVFTRDTNDDNDYIIAEIFEPATVEGVVKEVRRWTDEGNGNYLVMEDKSKHTYSDNTAGDLEDNNAPHPTLDTQYRLYEDPNGYVVGFEPMEDVSHNYLYVEDSDIYMSTAEAKVTFADGTTDTITLDDDVIVWSYGAGVWTSTTDDVTVAGGAAGLDAENGGLKNHVFAYTVDDGVYTLTALESKKAVAQEEDNLPAGDGIIKNDVAYITADGTRFIVDEKTAFVDVMDHTLYTGYSEVPNYDNAKFWVVDHNKNGVATVVFVYDGDKYDENAIWFYVDDATDFVSYDKNDTIARQHAWIDGEETDVLIKYDERDAKIGTREGLYKILQTNDDGVAIKIEYIGSSADSQIPNITGGYPVNVLMTYEATSVGSKSFFTNQAPAGADAKDSQWIVDDETVYVVIDEDGDIAPGTFKDIQTNPAAPVAGDIMTYVTVVKSAEDNTIARLIYIVQVEVADYRSVTFTGNDTTAFSVPGAVANTLQVVKGEDLTFAVNPVGANKIVSVVANGQTLTADAYGFYHLYDVTKAVNVVVTTASTVEYDVNVTNGANAFVTVNGEDYVAGTKVLNGTDAVIVVEPKTGYDIASVSVNGRDVRPVNGVYTYTVKNISADVNVAITYVTAPATVDLQVVAPAGVAVKCNGINYANGTKIAGLTAGQMVTFTVIGASGMDVTEVEYNSAAVTPISGEYTIQVVAGADTLTVDAYNTYSVTFSATAGTNWEYVTTNLTTSALRCGTTPGSFVVRTTDAYNATASSDGGWTVTAISGLTEGVDYTLSRVYDEVAHSIDITVTLLKADADYTISSITVG